MMKKLVISMATLALCGGVAFSQGMQDAYRFGNKELQGTARYMGMSGAFGALGGDISAMSRNPAGLAVYRSSEVVATLDLSFTNAKTDWLGSKMDNSRTKFNFDNIAYVGYFPTGRDEGLISWNAGFAYNRVKNFQRHYYMSSGPGFHTSLSDYVASRAYGYHVDELAASDAFTKRNGPDWLSALGYKAGFMDDLNGDPRAYGSVFGNRNSAGEWQEYDIDQALLDISESGAIDQYDFSFGFNISDIVLLGATFSVTDIDYSMNSNYDEFLINFDIPDDPDYDSDFYLENGLSTDGNGYGFNLGVIVKPVDYLRLGVAYNSPTWYKLTDHYYGAAASYLNWFDAQGEFKEQQIDRVATPEPGVTEYELRSPDRWIFSVAGIIGQSALISLDYELTNFQNMKTSDFRGDVTQQYQETNTDIKDYYQAGHTVRLGAEVKVTPQFSVRAGGSYTSSPVKSPLKNNQIEVYTVGTIPHYTVDKGKTSYSVGLGYRFTPQFYTDLACVLSTYKEDVYAFSSIPDAGLTTQSASMKTNRTQLSLTVGYKF